MAASRAGRTMPHPIRTGGNLPRTGRAKVCGTSVTRSGNNALIFGGGSGVVSDAGHTTIAPFLRISSAVIERHQRRGVGVTANHGKRAPGAPLEAFSKKTAHGARWLCDAERDTARPRQH